MGTTGGGGTGRLRFLGGFTLEALRNRDERFGAGFLGFGFGAGGFNPGVGAGAGFLKTTNKTT